MNGCTCPRPLVSVLQICQWCIKTKGSDKPRDWYSWRKTFKTTKPYPQAPEMHYPLR